MKKTAKAISVLLCLTLLVLCALPAFAEERSGRDVPNIHIRGKAGDIVNAQGDEIDNSAFPEGGLAGMVRDCMPSFLNALKEDTDEAWDAYRAKLFPAVKNCFGPMWLDKNGEASDGSHQIREWTATPVTDQRGPEGYGFDSYPLFVDWRLDPWANADVLHDYIQEIKRVTGSDKVNVNARCEAASVLLAYLAKYGCDDLHCIEILAATVYGVELTDALFAGKIQLDGDALIRYKDAKLTIEDELTNELVNAIVEFTGDTMLLDVTAFSANLIFMKLYDEVIAPLVRETYGTFPAFWAMVSPQYYRAARRGILGGYEEEYAGLLEKTDRYNEQVGQRVDEILCSAKEAGVKVAIFAKYGDYLVPPVTKNSNELNDDTILLSKTSLGATTAKYGKTLSESYLKRAAENGTDKYISADKMVDASTCLFPDTTWFIWGCQHEWFPDFVQNYMVRFFYADGELTVFDDPAMPQYVIAHADPDDSECGTLDPMTEENAPAIEAPTRSVRDVNWKDMIFRLLKAIWSFFQNWLKNR